jgi:hypothetical protein
MAKENQQPKMPLPYYAMLLAVKALVTISYISIRT